MSIVSSINARYYGLVLIISIHSTVHDSVDISILYMGYQIKVDKNIAHMHTHTYSVLHFYSELFF